MSYINAGARDKSTGLQIPTKKALKAALSQDPGSVVFYSTSPMGPQHMGPVTDMDPSDVLTVCGPDPYTKRNWWTNVRRDAQGLIYMDDKVVKPSAS